MDWLLRPWPWYVAGPLIGLTVPALLLLVGKPFGISSSFRHLGALCSPRTGIEYLKNDDWRGESWNLLFVVGILIGGGIAASLFSADPISFLPGEYQSWTGALKLLVGGLLVGFGTRYADGCTSGHTIMGLSTLNWSSLAASICFFAGGLFVVWLLPLVLS